VYVRAIACTLALAAVFIMQGYGIYVKNNLIEPKHIKAMQVSNKTTSLWLYLWFLDKITKIDEKTGLGVVLGRKPIKATDIVEVLGCNIKTARSMFKCLEDAGYIKTIRTPYGHQVYVTKAVKIFGNKERSPKSGYSLPREDQNLGTLSPKSGYSKKTEQLDRTNNSEATASAVNMAWNKYSDEHEEGTIDLDGDGSIQEEKKKTARKYPNAPVVRKVFQEVLGKNPANWKVNATQLKACENLYTERGVEKIRSALVFYQENKEKEYCPQISSPFDLDSKWTKLGEFKIKQT